MSHEKSVTPAVRSGHISVSVGRWMIVWGGFQDVEPFPQDKYHPGSELWMYNVDIEKWHLQSTSGSCPPGTSGACALVCGRHMYVFGGHCDRDHVNVLNQLEFFGNYTWKQLTTKGHLPSPRDKITGWVHNHKLFFFGGYGPPPDLMSISGGDFCPDTSTIGGQMRGWNNQLVIFDTLNNVWSCPVITGEPPCPRAAHASAKLSNKVFVFGGRHKELRLNDLHCLDLDIMAWSGPLLIVQNKPRGRSWHSLSPVSSTHLFLFGGFSQDNKPLNDCWLFDIVLFAWTEIKFPSMQSRLWHTAVSTCHNEVLVFGGCTNNILDYGQQTEHTNQLTTFAFSPKSLLRQCIDASMRHADLLRPEWHTLPKALQTVLLEKTESLDVPGRKNWNYICTLS